MSIDLKKYELKKDKVPDKNVQVQGKNPLDFLNKDIKLFNSGLSDKKKERFYSEMTILFTAGVDVKTALELIEEEQTKNSDKELFGKIREMVIEGRSISSAIEQTGKFSAYEYYSLQIGEESGKLSEVLKDLAGFFAGKIKQKRQIVNALSYPSVILLTAFGAIFFMMRFVVPMFADIFKRFKGDLPAITKLVIRISGWFADYSAHLFMPRERLPALRLL